MQLPADSTRAIQEAVEVLMDSSTPKSLIRHDDLNVSLVNGELRQVREAAEEAFMTLMRELMQHLPGNHATEVKAERAARNLIVDAVAHVLDAQLDRGDRIRRDG